MISLRHTRSRSHSLETMETMCRARTASEGALVLSFWCCQSQRDCALFGWMQVRDGFCEVAFLYLKHTHYGDSTATATSRFGAAAPHTQPPPV